MNITGMSTTAMNATRINSSMNRQRQQGAALILALLVVALAAVLIAAMLDQSEAALARTRNLQRAEQGWELMRGVEAWAAEILKRDFHDAPGIDSSEDMWNHDMPPIELPGIRIFGRLSERNGCFNLNSLHPAGADNSNAIARFERLLRALKLEPQIAHQAADWIDSDSMPRNQGAEDGVMLARRPAQRSANQPFTHISELRLLPAVTPQAYDILAPHVCAHPDDSPINLNFASPELWRSLSDNLTPAQAERLAREGRANYNSLDAIQQELNQLGHPQIPLTGHSVGSQWFLLEVQIIADDIPFLYSSLLQRRPDGIRITARARGRL